MKKEVLKGIEKACKYSYITNKKKYCGNLNAHKVFLEFLRKKGRENANKTIEELKSFQSLYPYLRLIAKTNLMEELHEKVVEAYWLGNDLLKKIKGSELKKMILNEFAKPGLLPKKIAEKKAVELPKNVFPCHSFHVLYFNFVTKKVEPILENLDKCLVNYGTVIAVDKKHLFLDSKKLMFNKKFYFEPTTREIEKGFAVNADYGDIVSFHWNHGIEVLSTKKQRLLEKYTGLNLEALNKKNLF